MTITTFHLKIFVFLIVFSPSITIASRSFYLFEMIIIGYSCFLILLNKPVRHDIYVFLLFITFVFIILFMQSALYGQLMALELLRMSIAFSILFTIKTNNNYIDFEKVLKFSMKVALFAAIIGIIQTLDGLLFSNFTGINQVLSMFYPYAGELTGSALSKSGGLQLKISSGSSATSTFDGHPILFSNFLVLAAIPFIYFKRYLGLFVILIALIFTFTRGSWLALLLSTFFYLFFHSKKLSKKDYFVYLSIVFIVCSLVFIIEPLRNYVEFRILNTLASFDLIDGYELGRSYDPRTDKVWPEFFDLLSRNGLSAYLWGVPSLLPTDSGYLSIIQNDGLIGLFLLFFLFIYIYFFQIFHKKIVLLMFLSLSIMFIVHPVFQGYKFLYFFIFLLLLFRINPKKIGIKNNVC